AQTHDEHAAAAAPAGKTITNAQKIRLALSAGPADITKNAAVMDMTADGKMVELRKGTNGWMCMAQPEAMCLDKEWQGWANAYMSKKDTQIKGVGIAYMLRGDQGASNTDPFATGKTATNNWVVSGPHIMVLTPDSKQLDALPTDWHSGGPWVMWKGTKYAHIMVPTTSMPAAAAK
ncbi:MAG TPA: hypothetical protein VLV86_04790, partial [Vicinamibacterales bacterium]|nr:hypothetical protein [Vicinamibacterales bacterium]